VSLGQLKVMSAIENCRTAALGGHVALTLDAHEFIRRFLIHVLPKGFHRISQIRLISRLFLRLRKVYPRSNPRYDSSGARACGVTTSAP
jgi:hypothetical protein